MCLITQMTYSHDLRTKALDYIEQGQSKVETSRIFGVTVQTLIAWCKRKKQGKLAPNATRNRIYVRKDGIDLRTSQQR